MNKLTSTIVIMTLSVLSACDGLGIDPPNSGQSLDNQTPELINSGSCSSEVSEFIPFASDIYGVNINYASEHRHCDIIQNVTSLAIVKFIENPVSTGSVGKCDDFYSRPSSILSAKTLAVIAGESVPSTLQIVDFGSHDSVTQAPLVGNSAIVGILSYNDEYFLTEYIYIRSKEEGGDGVGAFSDRSIPHTCEEMHEVFESLMNNRTDACGMSDESNEELYNLLKYPDPNTCRGIEERFSTDDEETEEPIDDDQCTDANPC